VRTPVVEKVLAYIVRDGRLLVFRHLDHGPEEVGIQVPAGTLKPGETPEVAVLREAGEETGLAGLAVVRKLGESRYNIWPYRDERQLRHVFELSCPDDVPERWSSSETDSADGGPERFECFWIPLRQAHVLQSGQGELIWRLRSTL